jgi:hypothetical protein
VSTISRFHCRLIVFVRLTCFFFLFLFFIIIIIIIIFFGGGASGQRPTVHMRGGDNERGTCCRKAFAFYRGAFFTLMVSLMGNIGTLVVLPSSRSCCSRGFVGFYKISGTSGIVREMHWVGHKGSTFWCRLTRHLNRRHDSREGTSVNEKRSAMSDSEVVVVLFAMCDM